MILVPDFTAKLTLQDIFNRIWEWSKTHPKCYSNETAICEYRNHDNTNACFFGCLIPDSIYIPSMERNSARGLALDHPEIMNNFDTEVTIDQLQRLQAIHDGDSSDSSRKYYIECSLIQFAAQNNLSIPESQ